MPSLLSASTRLRASFSALIERQGCANASTARENRCWVRFGNPAFASGRQRVARPQEHGRALAIHHQSAQDAQHLGPWYLCSARQFARSRHAWPWRTCPLASTSRPSLNRISTDRRQPCHCPRLDQAWLARLPRSRQHSGQRTSARAGMFSKALPQTNGARGAARSILLANKCCARAPRLSPRGSW